MKNNTLSHLRVLDLSRILAGPWCTQNLADLGADVIKVERPGCGDDTRGWGPPWIAAPDGRESADSSYFAAANRGKRSITIDIASAEGQTLVRELATQCDVVVENYKVGDLKRYGLDYESIRAVNPRIVYCSITGYGQDGPYARKLGYDFVFQGLGGLMSITGERDDAPGGGPQKVGVAVADILTGMYASTAILAALSCRDVSGEGQYIDMALLDCIIALGANQVTGYFASGKVPRRLGNAHPSAVPYEVFRTADGHVIIAVANDAQWQRYCEVIGRADLAADERYRKVSGRILGRQALAAELGPVMLTRSTRAWIADLEARDVPCGPINDYGQVFQDPQVVHRGMRIDLPRGDGGAAATIASPLRPGEASHAYHRGPPLLGEHTTEILADLLGKSRAEIARLHENGALGRSADRAAGADGHPPAGAGRHPSF